jgi:6-phosphofructokinase 1
MLHAMKRLGILVGGGPAPGINAVIGAATIEAINQGFEVIGFLDGLRWLAGEEFDPQSHTQALTIRQVARIHFDGGSILRTHRTSLLDTRQLELGHIAADPDRVQRVIRRLHDLGVNHLITIGGDDTALSAHFLVLSGGPELRVVHVPKTIDNDLPLPHDTPTFGYSTARYWGTCIVKNLMLDSQTTGRWYLATAMGRSAGWLALGIGYSAGATLTLIPEEFPPRIALAQIADILEGAILKRRVMGRHDGVAVLAEGLAYRLGGRSELQKLLQREIPMDAAGHMHLSDLPMTELLRHELEKRFAGRGEKLQLVTSMLGYQLRSADPTPGDMAYCRSLGHGCIRLLRNDTDHVPRGSMVTLVTGNIKPMAFEDMIDPASGRMRIRCIDTSSDTYRAARAYMIRLEKKDFENPEMLGRLAKEAGLSPEEFRQRYAGCVT